jgi:hypothetical protein
MKKRHMLLKTALWWAAFTMTLVLVSPAKLPLLLLVVPFVLFFFATRSTFLLLGEYVSTRGNGSESLRKVGSILATISVGMLALSSIGQLTLRDVLTIVLLILLGYFYIARNQAAK